MGGVGGSGDRTAIHRWIAELCCDLACLPATAERSWADCTALAAAVGRDPVTHGLTDPPTAARPRSS